MPRTKEEFDQWYKEKGGDPWGYEGDFVQSRLTRSVVFMQRRMMPDFDGAIVEIGAFNGDFTKRLAEAFPRASILANDISEVALDQARAKAGGYSNVAFDLSDLSEFVLPASLRGRKIVLTILEALYYLRHEERGPALKRLLEEAGRPLTYISGPIQGDNYFDDRGLADLFASFGYERVDLDVLNCTDEFRELLSGKPDAEIAEMYRRLETDEAYRKQYGRQVAYCFEPKRS